MRVVILGWELVKDILIGIGHFDRVSVDSLKDVVRFWCIFSFLFFIDTLILYMRFFDHFYIHCTYLIFYICWCMFLSSLSSCVVSFLSLYTCSLFLYAIYLFLFHTRCLDEFCLKCFRNTGCQSLLAINSLLAKFFKNLC